MNNLNEQISKYLEYCQYQKRLDEKTLKAYRIDLRQFTEQIPPTGIVKCSQFPSCVDFTGFNCIQNCVYCYYLSFFSKIALKHRPHYFHI